MIVMLMKFRMRKMKVMKMVKILILFSDDLDDDKVDDVVAEMIMAARKLMTRKFDDVHLDQGDDYHHLHWHDCNFYRCS